jgi:hypothetical protein
MFYFELEAVYDAIKKGLLYAPERGQLAFAVPGMHTFIAQQD